MPFAENCMKTAHNGRRRKICEKLRREEGINTSKSMQMEV